MKGYAENKAYGTVEPIKGTNPRQLYEHQKQAMENLTVMDTEEKYSNNDSAYEFLYLSHCIRCGGPRPRG